MPVDANSCLCLTEWQKQLSEIQIILLASEKEDTLTGIDQLQIWVFALICHVKEIRILHQLQNEPTSY